MYHLRNNRMYYRNRNECCLNSCLPYIHSSNDWNRIRSAFNCYPSCILNVSSRIWKDHIRILLGLIPNHRRHSRNLRNRKGSYLDYFSSYPPNVHSRNEQSRMGSLTNCYPSPILHNSLTRADMGSFYCYSRRLLSVNSRIAQNRKGSFLYCYPSYRR